MNDFQSMGLYTGATKTEYSILINKYIVPTINTTRKWGDENRKVLKGNYTSKHINGPACKLALSAII